MRRFPTHVVRAALLGVLPRSGHGGNLEPEAPSSPGFAQRVVSSIPTLLMSGTRDPATPVFLADSAALGLSNVERFVDAGAGHAFLDEAVRARMAKFFDPPR